MNTQSNYVYDDDTGQGLGRIAIRPNQRQVPMLDEPIRRNRPRQATLRSRRTSKPKPVPRPGPVIDKNPYRPPKLISITKKVAKKKSKKIKKSSKASGKSKSSNKKKNGKAGILEGSFNIGGTEISKTKAAMAGGGIAGGLLLWKLLF